MTDSGNADGGSLTIEDQPECFETWCSEEQVGKQEQELSSREGLTMGGDRHSGDDPDWVWTITPERQTIRLDRLHSSYTRRALTN